MSPVKNMAFKNYILAFLKFAYFAKSSKIIIYHFCSCLVSAILKGHTDLFNFDNVISITLKVPSIKISLPMGC